MIILIGGEKGGTGKTTIATNLAQMRASRGSDILLIDTDHQESSSLWGSTREENGIQPRVNCIQKRGKSISSDILDLSKRYTDIIIDAGGRDSQELRASLVCADIIIIPIQASQFDLWTLNTMEELVSSAKIYNQKIKAFCIINRGSTNPSVSEADEAKELFSELEEIAFPNIVLKDRITYRKAVSTGQGIEEMKPTDTKAKEEIEILYNFIFSPKVGSD